jgi:hypothetical protein
MVGRTMVAIDGLAEGSDEITFTDTEGVKYIFYHNQDCCEHVVIDDVEGDPGDLIGAPIAMAEEVSNESDWGPAPSKYAESWTWTFYKFATMQGYVTVKWLGESNGYYSESVDFRIEEPV